MRIRGYMPSIMTLSVLSILLMSLLSSILPVRSQGKPSWEIEDNTVSVTVGNINIQIVGQTGISSISIGGVNLIADIGLAPFAPGWQWVGGTWDYGDVLESPTVKEIPGGIRVRTHARFPPGSGQYFDFLGIYTIYDSGMIIANYTITAYESTDIQDILLYIIFPVNLVAGKTLNIAYGGTTSGILIPSKYMKFTISTGSFVAVYLSTSEGDVIVITLDPPSMSYEISDTRAWGGGNIEFKGHLASAGTVPKGTVYKVSLIIYPHTKGAEFTESFVRLFNYLGTIEGELLSMKNLHYEFRTPQGAKLFHQCEKEFSLAKSAFSKGDVEDAYTHAQNALKLLQEMKNVERSWRIRLYILIPGIIELAIILLVVRSALRKTKSFESTK